MEEGVDYAFTRPDLRQLAQLGKRFVMRYVGPGSEGKHLTADEARRIIDLDMVVVANAEGAATGLLGGYDVGYQWARSGLDHAIACGMPEDRPVYLSADWDVRLGDYPAVRSALKGACDAIGRGRVGLYGGFDVINWASQESVPVASWYWQTYAWSEGRWHPVANIRQYKNGVALAGGTVDLNRAMTVDFGQWPKRENDMELRDAVPAAATADWPGRTVNDVLGDLWGGIHQGSRGELARLVRETWATVRRVQESVSEISDDPITEAEALLVANAIADRLGERIEAIVTAAVASGVEDRIATAVVETMARRLAEPA